MNTATTRVPSILVVDDAPILRDLAQLFLASLGRVETACDGQEALERVRQWAPDLLVTDLSMPRMDGAALCRAVRADPALVDLPVVAMIGDDDDASAHGRLVRAGANDVLTKPLSRPLLCQTVHRYLGQESRYGQPRVDINAPADLRRGDRVDRADVCNVSRGGIFVESAETLDPSQEVALRFTLPGSEDAVDSVARVVWQRPRAQPDARAGHGLRFVDIAVDALNRIEDFVYERARASTFKAAAAPA